MVDLNTVKVGDPIGIYSARSGAVYSTVKKVTNTLVVVAGDPAWHTDDIRIAKKDGFQYGTATKISHSIFCVL